MTPHGQIGRYTLFQPIATGGMATVHLGRLAADTGFSRTVAIKRLHPHFASDPEFSQMFLDEARIVARIQHPNVVAMLDVVQTDGELFLVMDYVLGESLSKLLRASASAGAAPVPVPIATSIAAGMLHGLHAAHEATSEHGEPLQVVHRDVSPQNVIIGVDGVARVLDFGIAKAVGNSHLTRDGKLKGKIAYMPPEQVRGTGVDRRTDVYAASVVLWELLTRRRFIEAGSEVELAVKILEHVPRPPSEVAPEVGVPKILDEIVMRGLARDKDARWETAREMAIALEDALPLAPARKVGEWVQALADEVIARRIAQVREVESMSGQIVSQRASWTMPTAPPPPEPNEPVTEVSAPPTRFADTLDRPAAPPRKRGPIIAAAAVGVVAFLGIVTFALMRAGGDDAPGPAPAASAPASSARPPDVAAPESTEAPAASAPSAAPPASSSAPTKKAAPKNNPCDPPMYKDSRGILRLKPGCAQ